MIKLLYRMSFILRPRFWIMNNRYSESWDSKLNKMLDKPVFSNYNKFTVVLNGQEIWVENYPYASAEPRNPALPVRPRRETIVRLQKELEKWLFCDE